MKVYITNDSEVGSACREIAKTLSMPTGWEITDNPDESDVYISCFSRRILKPDFLEGRRCYNFHLGLLPKYGGVGVCAWVIINGETETGITLHKIDEGIDTGAVIHVEKVPIGENDTGESIYNYCSAMVIEMFTHWFFHLLIGDYTATVQQFKPHVYTRKMLEEAKDLTRFHRAFSFGGKEQAFYINELGEKVYLV